MTYLTAEEKASLTRYFEEINSHDDLVRYRDSVAAGAKDMREWSGNGVYEQTANKLQEISDMATAFLFEGGKHQNKRS